jgi:hypothetical protein
MLAGVNLIRYSIRLEASSMVKYTKTLENHEKLAIHRRYQSIVEGKIERKVGPKHDWVITEASLVLKGFLPELDDRTAHVLQC